MSSPGVAQPVTASIDCERSTASAWNYKLCAEREMVRIGYSYTLDERGAKQEFVVWGPNHRSDHRFVRTQSVSERRSLTT